MLWRVAACLLLPVLCVGCSPRDEIAPAARGSSRAATVMVDGHTVEAGQLSRTVAGLCAVREQVSTGPLAAKSTYDQRARNGIEITIRALRSSYSVLAARLAEASAAVDADLATDPPRPSLGLNVGGLTEKMREGLARLGISTTACPK